MAEARERLQRAGDPNENYAKVGHRRSWAESRDQVLNFDAPLVSPERLKLKT